MIVQWCKRLASIKLFNIILPLLILLLIIGTIAQKYIGLFEATQTYFFSPIIFIGPIPFPGMPTLLGILSLNLLCHIFFKSPWRPDKAGTIITHLGVLFLILGSLFTTFFTQEAYLDLGEGEKSAIISDYQKRELVLLQDGQEIQSVPFDAILKSQNLDALQAPFKMRIIEICENCAINGRTDATDKFFGMAKHMQLKPKKLALQNETNMAGLTIEIQGTNQDGFYTALEDVAKYPQVTQDASTYTLILRKEKRELPFTIELVKFDRQTYPGTDQAKSYTSYIRVMDEGTTWESKLSMNEPLRYKGYAIFQSSFSQTQDNQRSIFAIVYNPIRSIPYIAGLTICFGIGLRLLMRNKRTLHTLLATAMLMTGLLINTDSFANESPDKLPLNNFSRIEILDEGRIKPLDSFARTFIKRLSGNDKQAVEKLKIILFDTEKSIALPIFKISKISTKQFLNLEKNKSSLYDFQTLIDAFSKKKSEISKWSQLDPLERTIIQNDILKLHQNLLDFRDLTTSLTVFFPIKVIEKQDLPQSITNNMASNLPLSFYSAQASRKNIDDMLKQIILEKKDNLQKYSQSEQALALLSFALDQILQKGQSSKKFKVIQTNNTQDRKTPWQISLNKDTPNKVQNTVSQWNSLVLSYQTNNIEKWQSVTLELRQKNQNYWLNEIEILYNTLSPMTLSMALYFISFSILLIGYLTGRYWTKLILPILTMGCAVHLTGIITRIMILGRPPVGTLYESIIFSSAILVIFGLIAYLKTKQNLWLWLISFGGIFLNIIAFSHEGETDNLMQLSAVLNTNFWLTTHVLSITTGYALCALTCLFAHYILITRDTSEPLLHSLNKTALLALFFTTMGTILGGVWADQSWGRFWGWDPKENGALLIIFWLIWFLHGRVSHSMSLRTTLSGLAYLSIILGLSWFGVNLLNIGLHSYGFSDNLAYALSLFIVIQTAIIGFLFYRFTKAETNEVQK